MIKRICKQCGKKFVISDGEINFYKKKNLSLPKRCKRCRKKNKALENTYQTKKISNHISIFAAAVILLIIILAIASKSSLFDTSRFYANPEIIQENLEPEIFEQETYEIEDHEQENEELEKTEQESNEIESADLDSDEQKSVEQESIIENSNSEVSTEDAEQIYYTFSSLEKRGEHFIKHGDEFTYETAKEYEAGANKVINSRKALQKNEKEDGDLVYYIESTNEIVFLSIYGDIRTYFKPDDGIDYYNRQ